MLLEKILEYQKVDMEFYALENEFRKSQEVKGLSHLHRSYCEHVDGYERLTKETEDLFSGFEKGAARLSELEAFDKEINLDVKSISNQAELDMYDKSLVRYEELLSSVEREVGKITKRLADIKYEAQRLQEKIVEIGNRYRKQKVLHDRKKDEIQKQAAPIMKKLRDLKEAVEENVMNKYSELRKAKIMPAIVEYSDGNCSGCGMEIAIEVNTKLLKSGDYTECPECRRLVYKA